MKPHIPKCLKEPENHIEAPESLRGLCCCTCAILAPIRTNYPDAHVGWACLVGVAVDGKFDSPVYWWPEGHGICEMHAEKKAKGE